MFHSVLLATEMADEVTATHAGAALEVGGLVLLFAAAVCVLMGLFQGGDEHGGGSRLFGYGVAMAAASGISLYLSVQLGADPTVTAAKVASSDAAWTYPIVAIAGCLLYASHLISRSRRRPRIQRHVAERDAHARRGYASNEGLSQHRAARTSRR
jgi:hypothetical protein